MSDTPATPTSEQPEQSEQVYCCICNGIVEPWPGGYGWGHNPEPVKSSDDGRACNWCNNNVILAVRIRMLATRR